MSVFTQQDFSDWNGGTGMFRPQAVSDAIALGENSAAGWLNTSLVPIQDTEEFPWPSILSGGGGLRDGNKITLKHVRLISVDQVQTLFSDGNCGWIKGTECSTIFSARLGIIRISDPFKSFCSSGVCPERISITYTYGFPAGATNRNFLNESGVDVGTQLRAIVFNAALGYLPTAIGLNADGNVFKPSYSAAGYSESRQLPERSGAEEQINEHIQLAKSLARILSVRRMPRIQ